MPDEQRIAADVLLGFGTRILTAAGCRSAIAREVAAHLVDAELCGVYSHGIFRLDSYARRAVAGKYAADAEPSRALAEGGAAIIDGGNGLGIPALRTNSCWTTPLRSGAMPATRWWAARWPYPERSHAEAGAHVITRLSLIQFKHHPQPARHTSPGACALA